MGPVVTALVSLLLALPASARMQGLRQGDERLSNQASLNSLLRGLARGNRGAGAQNTSNTTSSTPPSLLEARAGSRDPIDCVGLDRPVLPGKAISYQYSVSMEGLYSYIVKIEDEYFIKCGYFKNDVPFRGRF